MKKVILSLCAVALVAGMSSCGSNSTESSASDQALGDSLSTAYGEFMGARAYSDVDRQIAQLPEGSKFNKADFMRGVKAVATRDTADLAYVMGLQYGMQIWGAAKGMPEQLKVPADAEAMVKAFEAVLNSDSIADPYVYQNNFQQVMQRVQQYAEEKEIAELEASPEAVANKEAGIAYADSLVNNAGYSKSESGLVYLIENPGEGETVKANDRLQIRYIGKHINGEVFDQTREEPMTSYAGRFIPGFTEGLQLLGKGGKATIVIPADLGYGLKGQNGTIGLNETLVFDIEVVDIL